MDDIIEIREKDCYCPIPEIVGEKCTKCHGKRLEEPKKRKK